jgi:hypothetical protein
MNFDINIGYYAQCLLNEKSTIFRLNGTSYGGNYPSFHFTHDPLSKRMLSIMFFPTYTMITASWWSITTTSTMTIGSEVHNNTFWVLQPINKNEYYYFLLQL